jgi:hypothetical protein
MSILRSALSVLVLSGSAAALLIIETAPHLRF